MGKFNDAIAAFWNTLRGKSPAPSEMLQINETATIDDSDRKPDKKADKKSSREAFEAGAIHTLTLLQREGRLIDFLQENIDAYEDSQIGAAVRRIHASCHKVINENFALQHIVDKPEGDSITLSNDFNPAEIRIVGDAPDLFPFNATVRHRGWLASQLNLAEKTDIGNRVITPAEVSF